MSNENIRPVYAELQGYLAQAPESKSTTDSIHSHTIWSHYNECVNQLKTVAGKDYSRFIITPQQGSRGSFVLVISYRQKLGGLISCLHGEYFSDESAPFSGMPNTVITQTQHQNQTVFLQMIFEFQDKIEQSMGKFSDDSKEKTFLQQLKNSLRTVTDVSKLVLELTRLAKESYLSAEDLFRIFS